MKGVKSRQRKKIVILKRPLSQTKALARKGTLDFHIHKQPLRTRDLLVLCEVVKGRELETNPAQILGQRIRSPSFGVTIEAGDEARTGEVGDFAEFEKGHQAALR